ncbi:hypothetical protein MINTM019_20050 [Mycobacterium paraintracellulare]|nr:hypothetical protein MINTM019_20050 [Mycobacterium paraintracellulare]
MRAEAECDVAVGCAVEDDLVGPVELGFVVVGREPAEDDPVVLSQALAAEDDVVSDCAAEGLVDIPRTRGALMQSTITNLHFVASSANPASK